MDYGSMTEEEKQMLVSEVCLSIYRHTRSIYDSHTDLAWMGDVV